MFNAEQVLHSVDKITEWLPVSSLRKSEVTDFLRLHHAKVPSMSFKFQNVQTSPDVWKGRQILNQSAMPLYPPHNGTTHEQSDSIHSMPMEWYGGAWRLSRHTYIFPQHTSAAHNYLWHLKWINRPVTYYDSIVYKRWSRSQLSVTSEFILNKTNQAYYIFIQMLIQWSWIGHVHLFLYEPPKVMWWIWKQLKDRRWGFRSYFWMLEEYSSKLWHLLRNMQCKQ